MVSLRQIRNERQKVYNSNKFLTLNERSITIRVVPKSIKVNESPFKQTYKYSTSKGTYYSPSTFGKTDPLLDLSNKLKDTNGETSWVNGKTIEPQLSTHLMVIDRDDPIPQIKIWVIGKTVYDKLLDLLCEYEDRNPLCPIEGFDLNVKKDWKGHTQFSIIDVPKRLSENKSEIIDLICKVSEIEQNFKTLEGDVWNEVSESIQSKIEQGYFKDGKLDRDIVSRTIFEVTGSINY